jgi:hypothetical protein
MIKSVLKAEVTMPNNETFEIARESDFSVEANASSIPEYEATALQNIFNAIETIGDNSKLKVGTSGCLSWKDNTDKFRPRGSEYSWCGVTIEMVTETVNGEGVQSPRVVGLDLSEALLSGTIPGEIGKLEEN